MIITKVGAIILNDDQRILVARKNVPGRVTFIIPGGKPEQGESDEDACRRELYEELGVKLVSMNHFGDYSEPSEFEDATVNARVYSVKIEGVPEPYNEILELAWTDGRNDDIELGSILSKHVIPALIARGLMRSDHQ
jgi:8-oxo-dGTP diphosphatase